MNPSPEPPSTSPSLADYVGLWPTCQPLSRALDAAWGVLDDQARRAAMLRTPAHDEALAAKAAGQSFAVRAGWAQHMMVQVLADLGPDPALSAGASGRAA
jgi:hypothetical protein